MDDAAMKRLKAFKLNTFATDNPKVSLKGIKELDPSRLTHLAFVVTPSTNKEQIGPMLLHFPHLQESNIQVVPNPAKPQTQSAQAHAPKAAASAAIKLPGVPVYEKYDLSTVLLKPESMALILKACAAQRPNTTNLVLHPQQLYNDALRESLKVFTNLSILTIGKLDYHLPQQA